MNLSSLQACETISSFINGKMCTPTTPLQPLVSPLTGQVWKQVSPATEQDVHYAIETAQNAMRDWHLCSPFSRAVLLRKIGDRILAAKNLLAETMAMEMGKPIGEGALEVDYTASYFHWFAGEAERLYGYTLFSSQPLKRLMIVYEPVGVCGIITPWNFPLAMAARKIAAALAAGCSVVTKPAPECPLSLLLLAQIAIEAGLPPAVFNVLLGDESSIGQALVASPLIRKLSFTGSTEVGRLLYRQAADTLKKLTLELGGHAPAIVFEDADIPWSVQEIVKAKFRNNGQTCIAPNRIFVHQAIYEAFIDQLTAAVKKLKVGSPLDPQTQLSNVLHPASTAKVQAHIADALKKGARAVLHGQAPYEPTILIDVSPSMQVWQEETFGPVLPIRSFSQDYQAIEEANASPYGLAAYIFTQAITRAHLTAASLQYGIIGLNDGAPSAAESSFGGRKESGFGREGGPTGIKEYLVEKFISTCMNP